MSNLESSARRILELEPLRSLGVTIGQNGKVEFCIVGMVQVGMHSEGVWKASHWHHVRQDAVVL